MNPKIISMLICSKGIKIMKIMKYVKKTPKTPEEISKATKIPIATTYRLILELLENEYLKQTADAKGNLGATTQKYSRGEKYKIIITPDGAKLK